MADPSQEPPDREVLKNCPFSKSEWRMETDIAVGFGLEPANICSSHQPIYLYTLLVETPEDTPEDDVCHLPSHLMNGVSYVVEYSLV